MRVRNCWRDLKKEIGKVLEHDDTDSDRAKGKELDTGFTLTTKQWEGTFGSRYWRAGAMYRGIAPTPVTDVPCFSNTLSKETTPSADFLKNTSASRCEVCRHSKLRVAVSFTIPSPAPYVLRLVRNSSTKSTCFSPLLGIDQQDINSRRVIDETKAEVISLQMRQLDRNQSGEQHAKHKIATLPRYEPKLKLGLQAVSRVEEETKRKMFSHHGSKGIPKPFQLKVIRLQVPRRKLLMLRELCSSPLLRLLFYTEHVGASSHSRVEHTLREGNSVANDLSKLDLTIDPGIHFFNKLMLAALFHLMRICMKTSIPAPLLCNFLF